MKSSIFIILYILISTFCYCQYERYFPILQKISFKNAIDTLRMRDATIIDSGISIVNYGDNVENVHSIQFHKFIKGFIRNEDSLKCTFVLSSDHFTSASNADTALITNVTFKWVSIKQGYQNTIGSFIFALEPKINGKSKIGSSEHVSPINGVLVDQYSWSDKKLTRYDYKILNKTELIFIGHYK